MQACVRFFQKIQDGCSRVFEKFRSWYKRNSHWVQPTCKTALIVGVTVAVVGTAFVAPPLVFVGAAVATVAAAINLADVVAFRDNSKPPRPVRSLRDAWQDFRCWYMRHRRKVRNVCRLAEFAGCILAFCPGCTAIGLGLTAGAVFIELLDDMIFGDSP